MPAKISLSAISGDGFRDLGIRRATLSTMSACNLYSNTVLPKAKKSPWLEPCRYRGLGTAPNDCHPIMTFSVPDGHRRIIDTCISCIFGDYVLVLACFIPVFRLGARSMQHTSSHETKPFEICI